MLRKEIIFAVLLTIFGVALAQQDAEIADLLSKMDGSDKCGQMTQVTLDVVKRENYKLNENPIDPVLLKKAIVDYKIGSILNTAENTAMKASMWQTVIKNIHDEALNSKHKIPLIYGIDSIHGATYVQEATLFPQPISQAATFNVDIAQRIGEAVAKETRSTGIPWNFSPALDIGRQPVWPRLWESYGEDVCLNQKLGEAYVKGHQGNNLSDRTKAATCLKHYIGYGAPFNGRDRSPAYIPESYLREVFLPPYETALKAGSVTIMVNSAEVNGLPVHANYHYLTEILKQELGFKGFAVSDWEDIVRLHTRDKVAETPEEAVRMAVMAGVDMSMVPYNFMFFNHCVSLYNKDQKFVQRVNDAVTRILTVKKQLGILKHSQDIYPRADELANVGSHDDLNLEAARESIILAKNENNFLPINPQEKTILVAGASANLLKILNGGWSYTWQGDVEEYFQTFSGKKHYTVYEALQKSPHKNIIYKQGVNFTHKTDSFDEAVNEAKNVDLIVLCVGEDTYTETPGNIDNMMLSASQMELANALLETNKPLVLVYIGGRPRTITSIVNKAKAVLLAFLPGNRGGEAIADIIYGKYNPNGKLPITYPKGPNAAMTYDFKPIEDWEKWPGPDVASYFDAVFPFGHGLSYTKFEYSDLQLNQREVNEPDSVFGSVMVKNAGNLEGKETVIVYLNDEYGSLSRPMKQMKFFKKVNIKPGESVKVEFEITRYDMSFINLDNQRIVESGKFNVYVGSLAQSFTLKAKIVTPAPATTTTTTTTTKNGNISIHYNNLFCFTVVLIGFILNCL